MDYDEPEEDTEPMKLTPRVTEGAWVHPSCAYVRVYDKDGKLKETIDVRKLKKPTDTVKGFTGTNRHRYNMRIK